jgi:hypothetical protein
MSTERKQGVLLLPCPFCGSINLRYQFSGSQGYIECNECGTQGPCDERAADPICDIEAANSAWNRRAALAQPEPEGMTDEEKWYPGFADWLEREMPEGTVIGDPLWWASKIADYLQRHGRPTIKPVPVAERPWEREGWCDAEGRCWWWHAATDDTNPGWIPATYADIELVGVEFFDSSLPHHALPVPTP